MIDDGMFTEEMQHSQKVKEDEVLILLRERMDWVSTTELVGINHRFSANICNLRKQGHVINGRINSNDVWEWRWIGYQARHSTSGNWQSEYYKSTHWRSTRERRLELDGHRCAHCKSDGGGEPLHVHHWRYDLFNEQILDLVSLCRPCHERIHANDRIKIQFPRFVNAKTYEQLYLDSEWQGECDIGSELDDR